MQETISQVDQNDHALHCLQPDVTEAKRMIGYLTGSENFPVTIQTYCEDKQATKEKKNRLARTFTGTIDYLAPILTRFNQDGAGVFFTVNQVNGTRRTAENIDSLRSLFADKDDGELPSSLPLRPSIIVRSKRGPHPYWLLKEGQALELFTPAQKALIFHLKSDPKVHDLPRVMRLPGFYHMKDPTNPFMIKIESVNDQRYSLEEVKIAFPFPAKAPKLGPVLASNDSGDQSESFRQWMQTLPREESSGNKFGGRNSTLLQITREGLAIGLDRDSLFRILKEYAELSEEADTDIEEMLDRQIRQHQENQFKSGLYALWSSTNVSAADIAEAYLRGRTLLDSSGSLLLRFHQGEAYRYNSESGHFKKWPDCDLRADVTAFIQGNPNIRKRAGAVLAKGVIANLEALTNIPTTIKLPGYLDGRYHEGHLIVMKNGILDLNRALKDPMDCLIPHTPLYFSLGSLPFAFNPKTEATRWLLFLDQMLPEREMQMLLQEWFGYNLIFDTGHHKFLLLIGEGANGKSVICIVLRCLLGAENISAVALEQFNPTRTFPMAATFGKLANIVEEIGEMGKTEEGMLKNFVAGGEITAERKNRDPFQFHPTARLTFATNVLPRFTDKSDGIWRRILPIPLTVQILDESEQDKRLVDPAWWIESDELPGVFNWALEGLERLQKRGRFVSPQACREYLTQYRQDSNPAATFLDENYCSV